MKVAKIDNFERAHEGCTSLSATWLGLDIHQTISHRNRLHERQHFIVSSNRPRRTISIGQLEGSRKSLALHYSNTISSRTESNETLVSAEIRETNRKQLDEITTVYVFKEKGEKSKHNLLSKLCECILQLLQTPQ